MVSLPLAHGALGWWDEIFVALAIGVFLVMFLAPMLSTTLRHARDESAETSALSHKNAPSERAPDSFRLE
jgi:hypothetical protein